MWLWKCKRALATAAATLLAACACFGLRMACVCRLSALQGKRTFYLQSASSQALCVSSLSVCDIFSVRGESVRFDWQEQGFGESRRVTESVLQSVAEEIAAVYGARVLFFEEAGGTLSAYCFAPELYDGIAVGGEWVNLHIAVRGKMCAVGTPLVFDGF